MEESRSHQGPMRSLYQVTPLLFLPISNHGLSLLSSMSLCLFRQVSAPQHLRLNRHSHLPFPSPLSLPSRKPQKPAACTYSRPLATKTRPQPNLRSLADPFSTSFRVPSMQYSQKSWHRPHGHPLVCARLSHVSYRCRRLNHFIERPLSL